MRVSYKGLIIAVVLAIVVAIAIMQVMQVVTKKPQIQPGRPQSPPSPVSRGPNPRPAQPPPEVGPSGEIRMEQPAMGTMVQYIVLGMDPAAAREAIIEAMGEVERLSQMMTDHRPESDISRINQSAGGPPVAVASEVFELLQQALAISQLSDGGFDVTMGALKGAWVIRKESPRVPTDDEIRARLPLVGWKNVILDAGAGKAGLRLAGMRIDLGGIAKGYIVDRAVEILKKHGVPMATVNAGGNIRLIGAHGDRPWTVGIQHPRDPENIIAWMRLENMSVATSGDYEKFIEVNGRRYCHIIDPRTGIPVSTTQSATVIAAEAWRADGLSTAVFVLGPEKGMALIESLPDVEGVIIDASGKRMESSGIRGRVNWIE